MAPHVRVANSQTTRSLPVALVAWGLGTKDHTVCGAPYVAAPHIDRFPHAPHHWKSRVRGSGLRPSWGRNLGDPPRSPPQERVHFRRQLKDVSLCYE